MSNEILWVLLAAVNFGAILLVYRFFGAPGLFAWMVLAAVTANVQVVKTVEIFGLTATLGNIVYASSFLATDILSENHGAATARKGIAIGFVGIVFFTVAMQLALLFEPAAEDFAHSGMAAIFSILPRITLASLVAYLASQLHDVWAFALWKRKFPSTRHLWLRNNMSTMVSQFLDSIVFTSIAFLGVFSARIFLEILLTTYVLKLVVAALDTPFLYIARRWSDKERIPS
ncbi:MAG: VUT family protein [Spirochaetaceae bacterium]|nr:MAG: VUT family protein [Spirochaetaceae bacterium]